MSLKSEMFPKTFRADELKKRRRTSSASSLEFMLSVKHKNSQMNNEDTVLMLLVNVF